MAVGLACLSVVDSSRGDAHRPGGLPPHVVGAGGIATLDWLVRPAQPTIGPAGAPTDAAVVAAPGRAAPGVAVPEPSARDLSLQVATGARAAAGPAAVPGATGPWTPATSAPAASTSARMPVGFGLPAIPSKSAAASAIKPAKAPPGRAADAPPKKAKPAGAKGPKADPNRGSAAAKHVPTAAHHGSH